MSTTSQVPMLDKSGNPGMVDADKVESATAAGFTPAAKMVGPKGEIGYVAQGKVSAARQSNYALTQDSPGAQKMVSPDGKVNFVLPGEVDQYKQAGHTLIRPNGTFDLQNIPGEDPLEEQNRLQRVYNALTPAEKLTQKKFELKEAAKTGAEAAVDTGLGVAGVAPEVSAAINSSRLGIAGGKALGTTAGTIVRAASSPVGQVVVKEGAKYILKGIGLTAGYALAHKFMKALGD